ncbi:hypothetical protein BDV96DRAFT_107312 [Lophiotrema nucula]|uniref:Uncharacterized protein n=1 Tax=Lophiotrema nucula TaxID=690887 RepID=A0A6A5Z6J4_9PLEO|nr:hypothetical protein BDV96DRAFT_107312 [Lophiotrema nucula]
MLRFHVLTPQAKLKHSPTSNMFSTTITTRPTHSLFIPSPIALSAPKTAQPPVLKSRPPKPRKIVSFSDSVSVHTVDRYISPESGVKINGWTPKGSVELTKHEALSTVLTKTERRMYDSHKVGSPKTPITPFEIGTSKSFAEIFDFEHFEEDLDEIREGKVKTYSPWVQFEQNGTVNEEHVSYSVSEVDEAHEVAMQLKAEHDEWTTVPKGRGPRRR